MVEATPVVGLCQNHVIRVDLYLPEYRTQVHVAKNPLAFPDLHKPDFRDKLDALTFRAWSGIVPGLTAVPNAHSAVVRVDISLRELPGIPVGVRTVLTLNRSLRLEL